MKSIKDLLIWYNNLNIVLFIRTIKVQRELFKRFDCDMFTDGVSLPGSSEKVMYQTCCNNLQYPSKKPAKAFSFPAKRMRDDKVQGDYEAKHEFHMTIKHLNDLAKKQKYLCGLCFCQLIVDPTSADRVNNKLGHIDEHIETYVNQKDDHVTNQNLDAYLKYLNEALKANSIQLISREDDELNEDPLKKIHDASEAGFQKYGEAQKRYEEAKQAVKGSNSKAARSALKAT
ncbi:hypothetical protein PC110_g10554 [Phytophthora cactorum]|uniref:Uncharacterized protein n=1 Tax=Phytophthora cactorum TaxID=29920 RepID=A0A329S873_9STRA|nr:hypothetical protein PC110_g10554 [Phytophthora cactorum]